MSPSSLAFKYFFIDLFGGIVRFPFWWYSKGLFSMVTWGVQSVKSYGKSIAFGVWIKNIFVPMFGQQDWQSRIISFFMRAFQILFRSFTLFIWSIVMIVLLIVYVSLPVFVAGNLLFHFIGVLASV